MSKNKKGVVQKVSRIWTRSLCALDVLLRVLAGLPVQRPTRKQKRARTTIARAIASCIAWLRKLTAPRPKRGRPKGSKNKPKPPAGAVQKIATGVAESVSTVSSDTIPGPADRT